MGAAMPPRQCLKGLTMLLAAAAASTAVDLLSQLVDKASAKGKSGAATQTHFLTPQIDSETAPTSSASASASTSSASGGNLSRETLESLLSAQGQSHGAERKKKSLSVLLDLMQSSQDGSVSKSDFEAASDANGNNTSVLFDKIDQDHDGSVSKAELSTFLDNYRRASTQGGAGIAGQARTLTMTA